MPRTPSDLTVQETPFLRENDPVRDGVRALLDSDLPALPVIDSGDRYVGIFGEREFVGAFFPGYLGELSYAGFVSDKLGETIEKRRGCLSEPVSRYMYTEHVDVDEHFSDAQIAEVFLHHRVLIVPVTADGEVRGVITRSDFFRALARSALESS